MTFCLLGLVKGQTPVVCSPTYEGKGHPMKGHEGPEAE
jgi:hypothetical protein